MSGYDYYKQQQRDRSSPNPYSAVNNPNAADYDPLALTLTAAQHQQQLAMLTSFSNYQNLFAFAPPPSLALDHALHGTTHHPLTSSHRHQHHQHSSVSQSHHHLPLSRHDSFDDLAGLVLEPPIDWSSTLPVPAPVVTTASAPYVPSPPPLLGLLLLNDPTPSSSSSSWWDELQLQVKDISVEPLSGTAVLNRLRGKLNDVLTKYIPCVGFLVDCQQSLRKGLEGPTTGGGRSRQRVLTAPQYYRTYVDHLPGEFCGKNSMHMDGHTLTEAYNGLLQLRSEAANAQNQGSEAVKSNFLGGMKDGESWGLRKWLSRHGGALHVCTDIECIVSVCRKLDPPVLERFSEIVRPAAKMVLQKLKTEIPASYQAHSTAHPYLPYYHRLEAALRNLSTLGEANDVICLDIHDDSDEGDDDVQLICKPSSSASAKRTRQQQQQQQQRPAPAARKRQRTHSFADDNVNGVDANALDDIKPPARNVPKKPPAFIKQDEDDDDEDNDDDHHHHRKNVNHNHNNNNNLEDNDDDDDDGSSSGESCGDAVEVIDNHPWPFQPRTDGLTHRLVKQVYQLADAWDSNQLIRPPHVHTSQFWRGSHFAEALRVFAELLDSRNASLLAERPDDLACLRAGQPAFSHLIKHPIAFCCIVNSLLDRSGSLPDKSLSSWNMFDGKDMLQAIDLVMLNSLAYGKMVNAGETHRKDVNCLRKAFWDGIHRIGPRKTDQPTKRNESSGFVIYGKARK